MSEIQIKPRRFTIELEEGEAASIALELKKCNTVSSPAYKFKDKLIKSLGYTPEEDIY